MNVLRVRAGLTAGCLLLSVTTPGGQQGIPPPSFRSRITIVPVDVRVLDRDGKPITDLTQQDFTITEDGVPQSIRYFSTHALTAEAPVENGPLELRRAAGPDALSPQNRRVFLILFGRGRMTGPSSELRALEEFLRKRLLPQDRVAVLAYNRGTDFTTDHEAVQAVVGRYRERHERIETDLEAYFNGLRGLYGSKHLPESLQSSIDAVFGEAAGLRPREITPGQITDARQIGDDVRRTTDDLQRAELLNARTGEFTGMPDSSATNTASRMDLSFDQYIAAQVELLHDVSNLYAGIDYLRYLEGEKHLVFLTPGGVALPRLENDRTLAAVAGDARVAIDVIYVGGAPAARGPRISPDGKLIVEFQPSTAAIFRQTATVSDMRVISEMTGGQLTAFQSADRAFTRIDQATRFEYLIGYSPANAAANGAYRRITIKVARPGATLLYRQGYYATPQLIPLDRRQFVTFNRLNAAGRYEGVIDDITVTLNPPAVRRGASGQELLVEGTIRSPRIRFTQADGVYRASLDLGVYAGDSKQQLVGDVLRKVDLRLGENSHRTFEAQGASFNVRVPLKGDPKYVKVIVYDYGADLIGTAVARITNSPIH